MESTPQVFSRGVAHGILTDRGVDCTGKFWHSWKAIYDRAPCYADDDTSLPGEIVTPKYCWVCGETGIGGITPTSLVCQPHNVLVNLRGRGLGNPLVENPPLGAHFTRFICRVCGMWAYAQQVRGAHCAERIGFCEWEWNIGATSGIVVKAHERLKVRRDAKAVARVEARAMLLGEDRGEFMHMWDGVVASSSQEGNEGDVSGWLAFSDWMEERGWIMNAMGLRKVITVPSLKVRGVGINTEITSDSR